MSVNHLRAARRCRRTPSAVAFLLLLSLFLFHSGPADSSRGDINVRTHLGPRLLFAAAQQRQCALLQDLSNYGVNLNLFAPNTVYLNGEYFCAESAPAQYYCKCGVATNCKTKYDPWGRNIGSCECCSSWMISCFIVLGIFSALCIFGAVYVVACQGRWWCDGYATLKASFMPRRGPAVSCPSSRPLPQNLFRGYAAADFINITEPPETFSSAGAAPASSPVNSPSGAGVGHEDGFGSASEARARRPPLTPDWHHS
ncbi:hypothetical protein JIQ42_01466 [Leishmania sp. Namibia]|uniref:hypothetical protein n=1 Tax=Leishmania sp. Namibia TaxID=2802991 RepID=UPI001B7029E0|nr:hypothetical protein JIQ42_01466 [Leishmania sp. Namibia]